MYVHQKKCQQYIHQKVSTCPKDHSSLPFIILMSDIYILYIFVALPALSSNVQTFHSSTRNIISVISWHNNLHIDVSNRRYKLSTIKIGPHLTETDDEPHKRVQAQEVYSDSRPSKHFSKYVYQKQNARRRMKERTNERTSGRPGMGLSGSENVQNGAAALRVHSETASHISLGPRRNGQEKSQH